MKQTAILATLLATVATLTTPVLADEPDLSKFRYELMRAEMGENEEMSKGCLAAYQALIDAGVSPSHKTRYKDEDGTIEYFKGKYCIGVWANAKKAEEKRTAPYRAKLKADKLKMAIKSHYAIAGGDYSMNPTKLAKAPVWFDSVGAPSNEPQHCNNGGKRNIVRRYQFNAKHVLVKRTEKQYCGAIPKSAYR